MSPITMSPTTDSPTTSASPSVAATVQEQGVEAPEPAPGPLTICGRDYTDVIQNCRTNPSCPTGDVSRHNMCSRMHFVLFYEMYVAHSTLVVSIFYLMNRDVPTMASATPSLQAPVLNQPPPTQPQSQP